jgi:hypothetical protein
MPQQVTDQLNQMVLSAAVSRAICTVAELGVADHIQQGTPESAAHLAHLTHTHERSLYRVLRFLAAHGVFHETENGNFDHTPLSYALRDDAEGSYRAGARMFHNLFAGWDGLPNAVQTGEPGFNKVFGKPIFDWVGEHPELGPILDAGMTCFHGYETAAMLDAYDFSGIATLADIGGGNGSLISMVLERYPQMNGILMDLSHVMGRARENIKAKSLDARCDVREGNFFTAIPRGADAYLFRHIIHDWTDEQSVQILRNCHAVLPAHGRLLLVECIVPQGAGGLLAKDFDMVMMTFPGGAERTEAEFRSLFEQSGFTLTSITPTSTMVSVIEGRPV